MNYYSNKDYTYGGWFGPRVGSGQTFGQQSRVESGQRFAGSGRVQEKWPVDNSGMSLRLTDEHAGECVKLWHCFGA